MSAEAFVPDDLEEPEEPESSEGNPGKEGEVKALVETLQRELLELREKVSKHEAPEVTVESILDSEGFRELVKDANAASLERVIAETPGLDEEVRKALFQTLGQMRSEGAGDDEPEPEPSEGEGSRCLKLRQRIQTLGEEIGALHGDRTAFTGEGETKRSEDRKLIFLLEAELDKADKELSSLLASVPEPEAEPEEDPDDKWSR